MGSCPDFPIRTASPRSTPNPPSAPPITTADCCMGFCPNFAIRAPGPQPTPSPPPASPIATADCCMGSCRDFPIRAVRPHRARHPRHQSRPLSVARRAPCGTRPEGCCRDVPSTALALGRLRAPQPERHAMRGRAGRNQLAARASPTAACALTRGRTTSSVQPGPWFSRITTPSGVEPAPGPTATPVSAADGCVGSMPVISPPAMAVPAPAAMAGRPCSGHSTRRSPRPSPQPPSPGSGPPGRPLHPPPHHRSPTPPDQLR